MTRANREDMVVISMGLNALLDCVRQTEDWWRVRGDSAALRRTHQLSEAIRATHQKFFKDSTSPGDQIAEALFVAEGLREAARHCQEGQAALHERLIGGAEVIERLCRLQGGRP